MPIDCDGPRQEDSLPLYLGQSAGHVHHMQELGWEDQHKAYTGLRTTLHTLRDRLPVEEAVQFGAQLPVLIRGL